MMYLEDTYGGYMNLKMLLAYINPSIFTTYKYDKDIMNTPSDITYHFIFLENKNFWNTHIC